MVLMHLIMYGGGTHLVGIVVIGDISMCSFFLSTLVLLNALESFSISPLSTSNLASPSQDYKQGVCSQRELFCPNTTLGGGEHQTKVLSSHILAFYLSIQNIILLLTPITNVLYLFICRCIMGPASLHIQSEIYRQFSNTKHPPPLTSLNAFVTNICT